MKDFPHVYHVNASCGPDQEVRVSSPGLPIMTSTAPPEFGGPEGYWSPETLLVAAVADCFNLTFRAIARASKLEWEHLECSAEGKLEKDGRVTRFTRFDLTVRLKVLRGDTAGKAVRILEMAEKNCLVTNSMSAEIHLETFIEELPAT